MTRPLHVLFVPFLFFKDFRQSSGVLFQADLVRALSAAGHNVTVLLPEKGPLGGNWEYDAAHYFGGMERVTWHTVPMVKNQMLWAGMMPEAMGKLLTPVKSPLIYDVVFNGNPAAALNWDRLTTEIGFAPDSVPPIVNLYDVATVQGEQNHRGGVSPHYYPILMRHEAMVNALHQAILTNAYDREALIKQAQQWLSPSLMKNVRENLHFLDKPLRMPDLTKRQWKEGEEFRVFFARGFGNTYEDTGGQGPKVHEALVQSIANLHTMGKPVKLVLCTGSDLDNEWAQEQLTKMGPAVEVHNKVPRSTVFELMKTAHLSVEIRGYNGIYMAVQEQLLSGIPVAFHVTKFSEGTVRPLLGLTGKTHAHITQMILAVMANYEQAAERAYVHAEVLRVRHDITEQGRKLGAILGRDVPVTTAPGKYQKYLDLMAKVIAPGPWTKVERDLLRSLGWTAWGKMPRTWLPKALATLGYALVLRSESLPAQYDVVPLGEVCGEDGTGSGHEARLHQDGGALPTGEPGA